MIGSGISALLSGFLADKIGRKPMIMLSALLFASGSIT
jgi:MFS family permease